MKRNLLFGATTLILCALPAVCQNTVRQSSSVPIYRVTVIQRSLKAINYQYRSGPTQIDFAGTVLLPRGKGDATVESKRGRTEIDARFEHMEEPGRFGREYLTYVLWAVTPEGRPRNLGEVMPDGSNKAKLRVSTDLQAFGLIVTAEPYSAVTHPSDVVVLENQVRPETEGKIEEINARYELMPRGEYMWEEPASLKSPVDGPKVSMDQYEALTELYQAQNAIGIAAAANARLYAPDTLAKAERLLAKAQSLQASQYGPKLVAQNAREAAQTAEDARVIAIRRQRDEQLAQAQFAASSAQQAIEQADSNAARARFDADAARSQAEADRAARMSAEADAAAARAQAAQAQAASDASRAQAEALTLLRSQNNQVVARTSELRLRLLDQLNGVVLTRDTPRGLVATLPDAAFSGPLLRGIAARQVARVAAIVASNPGLVVQVEGHTDAAATGSIAFERAETVRRAMLGYGLAPAAVAARGFGDTRLLVSNATAAGREQNRRIEIVISGDPIGNFSIWDRGYTLSLR